MFDRLFITLMALKGDLMLRLDRDEEGATMVEYGLLVVGIAVVVGAAVALLGERIEVMFDGITF
jgi:pilus assembly protein Flp/PilA